MQDNNTIELRAFKQLGSRTKGDKVIWTVVVLLALMSLWRFTVLRDCWRIKCIRVTPKYICFKQFAFIIAV